MQDPTPTLRQLGARAHQLRAATRAADHFAATLRPEDHDTGTWLMSCAVDLAAELAADLDGLARELRSAPAEGAWLPPVQRLRVRAHQLHAASRAADHYLEQDGADDHQTGAWLIACARGVAERLAAELDDCAGAPRPAVAAGGAIVDAEEAALVRRMNQVIEPAQRVA